MASDGGKIAWAQWRVLHPTATLISRRGFDEAVSKILDHNLVWLGNLKPADWRTVMNALGEKVRAARKAVPS